MDILDALVPILETAIVAGLTWISAKLVPPAAAWFRDNANNAFVRLLLVAVRKVVEAGDQIADSASTASVDKVHANSQKKAKALRALTTQFAGQEKRIKKVTGETMEEFFDSAVEAEVHQMKQRKAVAEARPR